MAGTDVDLVHYGATGPLSWITEGKFDLDAVMYFPKQPVEEKEFNEFIMIYFS